MTDNIKKIGSAVSKAGYDAIFITSIQNRFYATGFDSSAGELIITASGDAAIFIDARYFEEAADKIKNAEVVCTGGSKKNYEMINEYLEKHGVKTLAVEEGRLSYAAYVAYKDRINAEFVAGQKILADLRAIKSREEYEMMIKAQRIAEKAYLTLLDELTLDMTEKEAAAELTSLMLKNGAIDKSFDPILVSGSLSSVPHGKPRDVKLQRGFLTMDFGALYEYYCSDTTRTVCIGEPTAEMEKVYDTVLKAQLAAIDFAKGGMSGKDFDGAARKVIADAGYGEYFTHSLSHGLGIEVHEPPTSSFRSNDTVLAGAMVSCEPGIYLPGRFGVRIEDVLYITETGSENLTKLPKELTVICA